MNVSSGTIGGFNNSSLSFYVNTKPEPGLVVEDGFNLPVTGEGKGIEISGENVTVIIGDSNSGSASDIELSAKVLHRTLMEPVPTRLRLINAHFLRLDGSCIPNGTYISYNNKNAELTIDGAVLDNKFIIPENFNDIGINDTGKKINIKNITLNSTEETSYNGESESVNTGAFESSSGVIKELFSFVSDTDIDIDGKRYKTIGDAIEIVATLGIKDKQEVKNFSGLKEALETAGHKFQHEIK